MHIISRQHKRRATKYILSSLTGLILLNTNMYAQEVDSSPDPWFEPFTGMAYEMPIIEKKQGNIISKRIEEKYTETVREYPQLGEIKLEKLNIPETTIGQGRFPGIDRKVGFCMLLNSTMYIKQDGCYAFTLTSDDGSILWLEGSEFINNDGGHQMQMKKDSFNLSKGKYDIQLWYFQGMPDRFGLILDASFLKDVASCKSALASTSFEISSRLLFETGKHTLSKSAHLELEKLLEGIDKGRITRIDVIGHTDNVGDSERNVLLSQKRADSIVAGLKKFVDTPSVEWHSIGIGETQARASNETSEGRKANRRVEILIYLDNK